MENTVRENTGNDSLRQPLLPSKNEKKRSIRKASFFSLLTFSWLNPLLHLGSTKSLALEDVPALDSDDEAFLAYQTFFQTMDFERRHKGRTRNLVLYSLAKCYKKEMLMVGLYELLKSLTAAASPLILLVFISYTNQEERDLYLGLSLVDLLFVMKLVESFSQRHSFFDSRRSGMRMRSAVMAAIFQKQLNLSSQGRRRHSIGEIVNYIAVDAYRLGEFPWWFHMAWSQPFQIILCITILVGTMGLGTLPSLIPLIIFGSLNVPIAKVLQNYQTQFLFAQDERLRATSEALNNMKIIKLQSWEEKFRNTIEPLRNDEFKWLERIQNTKAYGAALYWMAPTVVSSVIFAGTAGFKSAPLNAGTIFTVLAALRVMSEPVRMLPETLSVLIQVKVSLDRIDVFLLEDEIKEDDVQRRPVDQNDTSVNLRNGFFMWDLDESIPVLKNINLDIKRGQKIAVCGTVGAGKSSLLYAILGEIPNISGLVSVHGSIAFVSQIAWIQSGTIRDNILYGKPMKKKRYEMAIRCALDKDIENFVHGDLTEIGQRGINMSGGQKQRIQLARAVYHDADIYLLDDPFSAVDAHTAAILHHVIEDGTITQTGTYEELIKSGTPFEKLVNAHQTSIAVLEDYTVQEKRDYKQKGEEEDHNKVTGLHSMKYSEIEISSNRISEVQLTENEEKEIGNFGWTPYKDYFQVSKGFLLFTLVVTLHFIFFGLQILSTYWLAFGIQMEHSSSKLLVGVYTVISILSCLFVYIRAWLAIKVGLKASWSFFTALMDSVFKAPMTFFDLTPAGRILTRASSDLCTLDFDILYTLIFFLTGAIEVLSIILIMATVIWQVLVVAFPVLLIVMYLQNYYLSTARELVRINGTTKAPVMNYAAESYLGVITIRAFGMIERFFWQQSKTYRHRCNSVFPHHCSHGVGAP